MYFIYFIYITYITYYQRFMSLEDTGKVKVTSQEIAKVITMRNNGENITR